MSDARENLPNTSKWLPREEAVQKLATLFARRCANIEERILKGAAAEKADNIDNFDHGPGVEDLVRQELGEILPKRYSIRAGVIDDRYGKTAGDFEVVILNDQWFPFIKAGATPTSRRAHFAIESVYSAIEVKSVLSYKVLDEAMEKLVCCHRLHRPTVTGTRISENRQRRGESPMVSNHLYTAILATGLKPDLRLEDLAERFVAINKTLKRHEMVRCLCILGVGAISWAKEDVSGTAMSASVKFTDDFDKPIYPAMTLASEVGSALYPLVAELSAALNGMILSPDNIPIKYGMGTVHKTRVGVSPHARMLPGDFPKVEDPEQSKEDQTGDVG